MMETPFSQPSRRAFTKSLAGAWNQVADIQPSGCHNAAKRAQSPASEYSTHFSTASRIASASSISKHR